MLRPLALQEGGDVPPAPAGNRARLWPRQRELVKVKPWGPRAVRGPCIAQGRANSPSHGLRHDARIVRRERGAGGAEYLLSVCKQDAARLHPNDLSVREAIVRP